MDLALDAENDLEFINGDMHFVDASYGVKQDLHQRLSLFLTEWFLDESKGIDYFGIIFVKNPNRVAIGAALKTTILETPGVIELLSFSLAIDTTLRALQVQFKVRTSDQIIEFNETLGG